MVLFGGCFIGFGAVLIRSRLFVFTRPWPVISVFVLSPSSGSDSLEAWSGVEKTLYEMRQGSMKSAHEEPDLRLLMSCFPS